MDTFRILCWDTEEGKWCDTGEEFGDPGAATNHACAEVGMPWVVVNSWFEPIEYGDANGLYEERAKRHDHKSVFNHLSLVGVHLPVSRDRQDWYWIHFDSEVGQEIVRLLENSQSMLHHACDMRDELMEKLLRQCDIWYYG